MANLIFITLQMMALTFVIGFVVAGVISLIAKGADYFEFHNSKKQELNHLSMLRKRQLRKLRLINERAELLERTPVDGYYHGVSEGASNYDLMDYYYPQPHRINRLNKRNKTDKK